jgi:hypothetical protein
MVPRTASLNGTGQIRPKPKCTRMVPRTASLNGTGQIRPKPKCTGLPANARCRAVLMEHAPLSAATDMCCRGCALSFISTAAATYLNPTRADSGLWATPSHSASVSGTRRGPS